jgi:hypothetical protein
MIGETIGRATFLIMFPFIVMALIGGVYYLTARPRVTFRQAMFRWWVVVTAFALLCVGLLGQLAQNL